MGINIGFFKATNGGYKGKITTLLHNLSVTFERILDHTSEKDGPGACLASWVALEPAPKSVVTSLMAGCDSGPESVVGLLAGLARPRGSSD